MSWFRKTLDKMLIGKVIVRGHGLPGVNTVKEKAKLLWVNDKQVFKSVRRKAEQEEKDKVLEDHGRLKTSGEKRTVAVSNCGRIKGFLEKEIWYSVWISVCWYDVVLSSVTFLWY